MRVVGGYYSEMLSILSFTVPAGTCASTMSPTFLPLRACAIGERIESLPSLRLAS